MYFSCEHPPKTKVSVAELDRVTKNIDIITIRRRINSDVFLVAKAMEVKILREKERV